MKLMKYAHMNTQCFSSFSVNWNLNRTQLGETSRNRMFFHSVILRMQMECLYFLPHSLYFEVCMFTTQNGNSWRALSPSEMKQRSKILFVLGTNLVSTWCTDMQTNTISKHSDRQLVTQDILRVHGNLSIEVNMRLPVSENVCICFIHIIR